MNCAFRRMSRHAIVDARGKCLFLSSESTTKGAYPAYVQGDWVQRAEEPVENEGLGALVRAALAASRVGVPFPDFSLGPTPERLRLLELAGVKSDAQYQRRLRTVRIGVGKPSRHLRIAPFRNGGRRDGFTEIAEQVITLDADADNATLGATVRRALHLATDGSEGASA